MKNHKMILTIYLFVPFSFLISCQFELKTSNSMKKLVCKEKIKSYKSTFPNQTFQMIQNHGELFRRQSNQDRYHYWRIYVPSSIAVGESATENKKIIIVNVICN